MRTALLALTVMVVAITARSGGAATPECMNERRSATFAKAKKLYLDERYIQAADILSKLSQACPCDGVTFWFGKAVDKAGNHERAVLILKGYLSCDLEAQKKVEVGRAIEDIRGASQDSHTEPADTAGMAAASDSKEPLPAEVPSPSNPQPGVATVASPPPTSAPVVSPTAPPTELPRIPAANVEAAQSTPKQSESHPPPMYKTWWFWTGVAVIAGTITTVLVVRGSGSNGCSGFGPNCVGFR